MGNIKFSPNRSVKKFGKLIVSAPLNHGSKPFDDSSMKVKNDDGCLSVCTCFIFKCNILFFTQNGKSVLLTGNSLCSDEQSVIKWKEPLFTSSPITVVNEYEQHDDTFTRVSNFHVKSSSVVY